MTSAKRQKIGAGEVMNDDAQWRRLEALFAAKRQQALALGMAGETLAEWVMSELAIDPDNRDLLVRRFLLPRLVEEIEADGEPVTPAKLNERLRAALDEQTARRKRG
jgi:hypothetical protein